MMTVRRTVQHFLDHFINNKNVFTASLIAVFIGFSLVGILTHEMWRDELQAWMIARDSFSFSDLLNNLKYEGHPALWHSCLYLISRLTRHPLAMRLFHLGISTSVVYLFIAYSPFTKLQKALFTFSYFPFYEYNVLSRNYSLGVLCILLICLFYRKRYQQSWLIAGLVAALANTNIYGLILAIVLTAIFVIERVIERDSNKFLQSKSSSLIALSSLGIAVSGIAIAVVQLLPAANLSFQTTNILSAQIPIGVINLKRLSATLSAIWQSYVPIPNVFRDQFWNTNLLESQPLLNFFVVPLAIGLILISVSLLIKKPLALLLYGLGTGGILLFTYLKYVGELRHYGYLFILLLACLWIASDPSNSAVNSTTPGRSQKKSALFIQSLNRQKQTFLNLILCAQVSAGLFALSSDVVKPFSSSRTVAQFIERQQLTEMPIIGSKDTAASSVSALLDRKIYYPESQRLGSFIIWNQRQMITREQLLPLVVERLNLQPETTLLLLNYRLKAQHPQLTIMTLLETRQSIAPEERFYLYRVNKTAAS